LVVDLEETEARNDSGECRPIDQPTIFGVYIHGTKTTLPHERGEEPKVKGAYMISSQYIWELHTHNHPCRCASNPNRETTQWCLDERTTAPKQNIEILTKF
jgi:hypothetical protein